MKQQKCTICGAVLVGATCASCGVVRYRVEDCSLLNRELNKASQNKVLFTVTDHLIALQTTKATTARAIGATAGGLVGGVLLSSWILADAGNKKVSTSIVRLEDVKQISYPGQDQTIRMGKIKGENILDIALRDESMVSIRMPSRDVCSTAARIVTDLHRNATVDSNDWIQCPTCRKLQHRGGKFCISCGTALQQTAATTTCAHCKKIVKGDALFCPFCGYLVKPGGY